ncbi:hypothetical protein EDM56_01140 [Brevibacillus fluminis]|uniref:Asp/Glu racemase n=1 Tax=Brevibacillus fluminis TaxID=511487 RepID=A0A3M8DXR2_9BACL|nr:hypothetical protein [Brevibacillus fluminis]RNB92335.1 hypothetical protein EDM56_01140 [Brevibacillus fluminis]
MKNTPIRISCLHAHHSNIALIDAALVPFDVELVHFVDPGLVHRLGHDPSFDTQQAERKIADQLDWITRCGADLLLITCTNYIAAMKDQQYSIPLIKIDEPFFAEMCAVPKPIRLVFTNPATMDGTVSRLMSYAASSGKAPQITVEVVPDSFVLVMQGKLDAYNQTVSSYLIELQQRVGDEEQIWAAQLSMVAAAQFAQQKTGLEIGDPQNPLVRYIARLMSERNC